MVPNVSPNSSLKPGPTTPRQQDCDREQRGPSPFEKRLQSQPEIQSDTGVRPRDRQQRELHHNHIRSCDPITEQRRCIAHWNAPVDPSHYPLSSEVTTEQERNAEAQDKLRNFGSRVTKISSLVER